MGREWGREGRRAATNEAPSGDAAARCLVRRRLLSSAGVNSGPLFRVTDRTEECVIKELCCLTNMLEEIAYWPYVLQTS